MCPAVRLSTTLVTWNTMTLPNNSRSVLGEYFVAIITKKILKNQIFQENETEETITVREEEYRKRNG
jgi:hypothetical protein